MKSKIFSISILVIFFLIAYLVFWNQTVNSTGKSVDEKVFTIEKGESFVDVGKRLESESLIANDKYFTFYVFKEGFRGDIIAGDYLINPEFTIPEIVTIITSQDGALPEEKRITFPEGWTSKKMAERLSSNGYDGEEFLDIVKNPSVELVEKYDFLSSLPDNQSLEGFLFPDTYRFIFNSSEKVIVERMLDNFEKRLNETLRQEIEDQGKTIYDIVTMASIIEVEVRTYEDRKIVSGIFWKRVENDQRLQSSAPLTYLMGINKRQYSYEDTQIDSPYNTYMYAGLPPGPISNPGISSIKAAIYPTQTDYNFFLNNPETGDTVFSVTHDEHVRNKRKNGL